MLEIDFIENVLKANHFPQESSNEKMSFNKYLSEENCSLEWNSKSHFL